MRKELKRERRLYDVLAICMHTGLHNGTHLPRIDVNRAGDGKPTCCACSTGPAQAAHTIKPASTLDAMLQGTRNSVTALYELCWVAVSSLPFRTYSRYPTTAAASAPTTGIHHQLPSAPPSGARLRAPDFGLSNCPPTVHTTLYGPVARFLFGDSLE